MADPKPLLFVCPACGCYGAPEVFGTDDDNKLFGAALGQLGNADLALAVSRYLGLFRPAKRRLSAPRANRLLAELVPMMVARRATIDGREWPAPPEAWLSGINEMLDGRERLRLPMDSHNYLLRVVIARAPTLEAAAEAAAEAEAAARRQARPAAARARFQETDEEFVARRRVEGGVGTDHDKKLVQAAAARRQATAALQRIPDT